MKKMKIIKITGPSIFFLSVAILIALALSTVVIFDESYAISYSNYTSNQYQIQFQYPTDWQITEKKTRFDEGTDLQIQSFTYPNGQILIQTLNFTDTDSSSFNEFVYDAYKEAITSDYSLEYKVIEQPTFLTIDGQQAGTYLYTTKDKYEENAVRLAIQNWVVGAGDRAYLIWFTNMPANFDKPEVTEIRDHFIKSIKFLGISNTTESTQPSRF
jgi:hypothetical protein